jgi:signal transduction histidine kinase
MLAPDDVAALLRCSRALAPLRTLDETAAVAARLARELVGADGACIVLRDGAFVQYIGENAIAPLWVGKRFPVEQCVSGWAIVHADTAVIPDIETDARIPIALYRGTFVRSLVMAPVDRDEPFAAVGAYWKARGGPSPHATALLEAFAGDLAVALANARRLVTETDARAQAESVARAKDEFLAMLGHELRNPLAPIVTALHLIKLRGMDPFERERAIIDRQVQHVVRLVDDLLDVSRITRGVMHLRRTPIEASAIVRRALEAAAPTLAERDHDVAVRVPQTGLPIDADFDRLTQVVANLLTNAAKYTPRGGKIEVAGDVEAGCVRLVVRDNGAGIDPKLLPRLFDLFVQGKPEHGGLGLGLAIVRSIVEMHGGVVSAASRGPGRGSTFTIRLPLAGHSELDTSTIDEALPTAVRGLRVLVVDDNIDAAQTLGELLEVMGHQTMVVHDGPSALEAIQTFTPEVAFFDIGLPVIDGYELAREVHAIERLSHVPLVAITGYGQPADRERAAAAGFVEHLVKPLSVDGLRGVLARLAPS